MSSWSSRLSFFIATIGSAIGLGNLWRFSFLVSEHGSSFVILYTVCCLVIAFPCVLMESAYGASKRKTPLLAVKDSQRLLNIPSWVCSFAFLGVVTSLLILCFYFNVTGHSLAYIYHSLFSSFYSGEVNHEVFFAQFKDQNFEEIVFLVLSIAFMMLILSKGLNAGIERVGNIGMPVFFFLLVFLIIQSFINWDYQSALKHLFLFSDSKEFTGKALADAAGHAFFSISIASGIFLTYGSYLQDTKDLPKTSILVVLSDYVVNIIASFIMLSIMFTHDMDVSKVGGDHIFTVIPFAFSQMNFGIVFGIVFYVLVFITAITSLVALLDVVSSSLREYCGLNRWHAIVILSIFVFIANLGSVFSDENLAYVDELAALYTIPIGGTIFALFIGFFGGFSEIKYLKSEKIFYIFSLNMMRTIVPAFLIIAFISKFIKF